MRANHPCPDLTVNQMLAKCGLDKRFTGQSNIAEVFDPAQPDAVLFTGRAGEVDDWLCDNRAEQLRQP